ncbi:replication protein A 14 kDa subunit isoform X2 [Phycodurus eques]|uniref:replication protein A 14 kDa subunit isoform X2 n=1 Tax=Phycodurus eques TaxID=693459 RepID=UPI002ACEBB8E|nr:replication protein A 14 kDa subunit isoform X2 [Phycodurus eques]
MSTILDVPRPRINFSMLSRYISKPVCFVGRVEKVTDSERSVQDVPKLEDELSGIVEVIGMVSNKGAIMATAFSMLRDEKGSVFDLELYNEAVKVIHDFPQHYPFDAAASG